MSAEVRGGPRRSAEDRRQRRVLKDRSAPGHAAETPSLKMSDARIEAILRAHDLLRFPMTVTVRSIWRDGVERCEDGTVQSLHDIVELIEVTLRMGVLTLNVAAPGGIVLFHYPRPPPRWHLPDTLRGPPPRPRSPGID
jgi:hypothetical protein